MHYIVQPDKPIRILLTVFQLKVLVVQYFILCYYPLQMESLNKCELQNVCDPTAELPPVNEEEDESMLADCISIGMQNSNRSVISSSSQV